MVPTKLLSLFVLFALFAFAGCADHPADVPGDGDGGGKGDSGSDHAPTVTASWCGPAAELGVADVDGDGRADAVCHDPGQALTSVALSNGTRFVQARDWLAHWCGVGDTGVHAQFRLADVDGDGRADAVCHEPDTNLTSVALSNGSVFQPKGVWLAHWCGLENGTPSDFGIADFDGDGRGDLYCHEATTALTSVAVSTGAAFSARGVWLSHWCGFEADGARTAFGAGDVNADGVADLYCHESDTALTSIALSQTTSFAAQGVWLQRWCGREHDGRLGTFGMFDVDADGRADVYCHESDTFVTSVALSTGSAFAARGVWLQHWCGREPDGTSSGFGYGDLTGDGRDDVFCHETATSLTSIARSDGAGALIPSGVWTVEIP